MGHQSLGVYVVSVTYLPRVFEILGKTCISLFKIGYFCLLFTNMSFKYKHGSDKISTWSKWDDHAYELYPVMCRSVR